MTENKEQVLGDEVLAKIAKAKEEGHVVFSIKLAGVKYVYRSINREEFRELQLALANDAEKVKLASDAAKIGLKEGDPALAKIDSELEKKALDIREAGEDRLVVKGLIHPELNKNTPAGVSTTLADRIMEASAFGSEEEPEML